MDRRRLEVIIIGAGTGGLCLAQGLVADNVAANTYAIRLSHLFGENPEDRAFKNLLRRHYAGTIGLRSSRHEDNIANLVIENLVIG